MVPPCKTPAPQGPHHISPLHPLAVVSPIFHLLEVDKLELELRSHPDQAKVEYVITSLRHGFVWDLNLLRLS